MNVDLTNITKADANEAEARLRLKLEEGVTMKIFHISDQLKKKVITKRYNSKRCRGFTIILTEKDGKYYWQASRQSANDPKPFSRTLGRYVACLNALEYGFLGHEIPSEAFKYSDGSTFFNERCAINYYITNVINYKQPKEELVSLPGLSFGIKPKDVTASFLSSLEEITLQCANLSEEARIKYFREKQTGNTVAAIILNKDASTEAQKEFFELEVTNRAEAFVKRYYKDVPNKNIARYYALYKLFSNITSEA